MYEKFNKINGTHPWRDVSPEGYLDYPACYRRGGRVLFFNFELAKEMGLIPKRHRPRLNKRLEEVILKTLSIQILNEHDWVNRKSLPKDGYEDHLYMATRYLQLQHKNKQGETSGDGRSIWNGHLRHKGKIYDVSSRGTGATILSPGAQEADGPIKTGDDQHGYASGRADLDEMMAGAFMSEIIYRQDIPTERTLAVIEFSDKSAIGVRAGLNLIRPAHFFRYLKLGNHKELKDSFDYFLKRDKQNKVLKFSLKGKGRYFKMLDFLTKRYAYLSAVMEEEYIFNWLAWDGDNLLASGGLLDYGSIRQFAAKHTKYRYEDVDRFSTCLTEQKYWAKYILQTFVQAVDFVVTGKKRPLNEFEDDAHLKEFDRCYESDRQRRMLWKIGFTPEQINKLMENHVEKVVAFRKALNYFEHLKTVKGEQKVPDGIDHPPIFLIRHILRELPKYLLRNKKEIGFEFMPADQFCEQMAASYVHEKDLELSEYREQRVKDFQKLYIELLTSVKMDSLEDLKSLVERVKIINHAYRSTGDGLTWIVHEAIQIKDVLKNHEFQEVIERFIQSQVLIPGKFRPIHPNELRGKTDRAKYLKKIVEILDAFQENI